MDPFEVNVRAGKCFEAGDFSGAASLLSELLERKPELKHDKKFACNLALAKYMASCKGVPQCKIDSAEHSNFIRSLLSSNTEYSKSSAIAAIVAAYDATSVTGLLNTVDPKQLGAALELEGDCLVPLYNTALAFFHVKQYQSALKIAIFAFSRVEFSADEWAGARSALLILLLMEFCLEGAVPDDTVHCMYALPLIQAALQYLERPHEFNAYTSIPCLFHDLKPAPGDVARGNLTDNITSPKEPSPAATPPESAATLASLGGRRQLTTRDKPFSNRIWGHLSSFFAARAKILTLCLSAHGALLEGTDMEPISLGKFMAAHDSEANPTFSPERAKAEIVHNMILSLRCSERLQNDLADTAYRDLTLEVGLLLGTPIIASNEVEIGLQLLGSKTSAAPILPQLPAHARSSLFSTICRLAGEHTSMPAGQPTMSHGYRIPQAVAQACVGDVSTAGPTHSTLLSSLADTTSCVDSINRARLSYNAGLLSLHGASQHETFRLFADAKSVGNHRSRYWSRVADAWAVSAEARAEPGKGKGDQEEFKRNVSSLLSLEEISASSFGIARTNRPESERPESLEQIVQGYSCPVDAAIADAQGDNQAMQQLLQGTTTIAATWAPPLMVAPTRAPTDAVFDMHDLRRTSIASFASRSSGSGSHAAPSISLRSAVPPELNASFEGSAEPTALPTSLHLGNLTFDDLPWHSDHWVREYVSVPGSSGPSLDMTT